METPDDGLKRIEAVIADFRKEQGGLWLENKAHWDENNARWDSNNARWDSNNARWDANEARWDANEARWDETKSQLASHDRRLAEISESNHRAGLVREQMQSDIKLILEIVQETRENTIRKESFQPLYDDHEYRIRQLESVIQPNKE